MANTDILSLAKRLGAKNIYDNPFTKSQTELNYANQQNQSDYAEKLLNEASNPVAAIGAGINYYIQSKRQRKLLDELSNELKNEDLRQQQNKSILANLFPENQRQAATSLDMETLTKLAEQRLRPVDPNDELDRRYKQAQIERLNRENSQPISSVTGRPMKELPPQAIKMQNESLDIIGTAKGINADLSGIEQQIQNNTLKLGPVKNVVSSYKNYTGNSSPNSRNYQSLNATLQRLRNDSLRLNKGVQTEGDSVRAWNELLTNINDPEVVKQRLSEIKRINERAADLQKLNIDQIRANYGADPLDYTDYNNRPGAIGSGQNQTGFKINIRNN